MDFRHKVVKRRFHNYSFFLIFIHIFIPLRPPPGGIKVKKDGEKMKISTKGRYALRTLVDLAQHSEEGLIPLKDVAARQGISQKYLEQIVTQMNKAGFLHGVRGPQGGYRLAREPKEYTLAEILQVMEGDLAPVACLENQPNQCERYENCATVKMWEGLYQTMLDYLNGITLQQLVDSAGEGDFFDIGLYI